MPWTIPQFLTATPSPYAGFYLVFYAAGTSTPQNVYSDQLGNTSLGNQVILDTTGYPSDGVNPVSIYYGATGYRIDLCPPNLLMTGPDTGSPVRSVDNTENVGQVYISTLGTFLNQGQRSMANGATLTSADNTATFLGSGSSGVINLQPVATRMQDLTIQVIGTSDAVLTPHSGETINGQSTWTVTHGTSPKFAVLTLRPDAGNGGWIIVSGAYLT
jgi:hypothetical protein